MKLGYWLLILTGLLFIFIQFKKFLFKYRFTKYEWEDEKNPLIQSRKHKAKLRANHYKSLALFTSFAWIVLVTNIALNYLRGWFVLIIFGLLLAYAIKSNSMVEFESKLNEEITVDEEKRIKKLIKSEDKSALTVLVVSVAISLNWGYQVQRNENDEKISAINALSNLSGQGWCSAFWDVNAVPGTDGNYDVSKTGGWPCITVGSVSNTRFSTKHNELEMCFNFLLRRSNDGPWNTESSEEYHWESSCASNSGLKVGGGWSEDSLLDNVRNKINLDLELKNLQISLCRIYYPQMSAEARGVYC